MEHAIILFLLLYIGAIQWFHKKERDELLNRFMAKNLTELQATGKKLDVKRSESGNYLLDSMKETAKHFQNE